MLAAGELPGGKRQIVRHALVQVTEAIRQGPQGDGGTCMKSALGFYVAPSRYTGFGKCSSDRFSSRVRRGGTCGGKQTKSVRIVGGKGVLYPLHRALGVVHDLFDARRQSLWSVTL